jgi:probable F420-dependent oxidoreductase
MVDVARRAEQAGYASLWTFQRLLNPSDHDYGPMYRAVHDPLIALAHVAAVTEHIRLGVGIVNMPYYSPVLLAKQLTTLDVLSAGRLDAGLGLGWSREEFEAVGVPYERRGARSEEFLDCLRAVWTGETGSFDGEFYRMPAAHVLPRPVQQPHPPVLIGGSVPAALRRVGRLADGWISSSRFDAHEIDDAVRTITDAAVDAGRDPSTLRFIVRGVVDLGDHEIAGHRPLSGSASQIRDDIQRLGDSGVTEVFLDLNFHPRVGSPDADAREATAYALRVLETFAPA